MGIKIIKDEPKLEQNTKEWKEWRKNGIGASDANVIMGTTDKSTKLDLYENKVNGVEKDVPEFIVAKGHKFEEMARAHYELLTFKEFPPKLMQHKDYDFMIASLDGFCEEDNQNWECKFCGKDKFDLVKSGKCIPDFYPQIQHQMLVSGADSCVLHAVWEDGEKQLHHAQAIVQPDKEYMAKLLIECEAFWKCIQDKTPPQLTNKDQIKLEDAELKKKVNKYVSLDTKVKKFKKEADELKKEIFEQVPHTNVNHNGTLIQTIEKSGAVDWKKAYEIVIGTLENTLLSIDQNEVGNVLKGFLDSHDPANFKKPDQVQQKITPKKPTKKKE